MYIHPLGWNDASNTRSFLSVLCFPKVSWWVLTYFYCATWLGTRALPNLFPSQYHLPISVLVTVTLQSHYLYWNTLSECMTGRTLWDSRSLDTMAWLFASKSKHSYQALWRQDRACSSRRTTYLIPVVQECAVSRWREKSRGVWS